MNSTLIDSNVLIDLIDAAVAGHTLLIRDPRRYRHYFSKLRIIAP